MGGKPSGKEKEVLPILEHGKVASDTVLAVWKFSDEDMECITVPRCKAQDTDICSSVRAKAFTWLFPKV